MRPRILIVDDQPEILRALSVVCAAENFEAVSAESPKQALALVAEHDFDLALIDMNYDREHTSSEEGLALLQSLQRQDPALPVVVMTAWASISLAVDAIRMGAKDFLQKPWNNERLVSILRTQIQLKTTLRDNRRLEAENEALRSDQKAPDFVSSSPAMQRIDHLVQQIAPSDANVLITGESGTGKNVVATRLHRLSARAGRPLISVNMGAIPDGLFESEMFGHVKGAFTDARTDRVGRFELADQGTLFLDEIANLSSAQQAKVLRILETGEFERVGSSKTQTVDVRVLSATNADPAREIQLGKFREDLLFRLNTIQIHLPPLRERLEDLPTLIQTIVRHLGPKYRKPGIRVSAQAVEVLRQYAWPGNIRELRHVLERSILLTKGNEIDASQLWLQSARPAFRTTALEEMNLAEAEAYLLRRALVRYAGDANLAAKALGLSRSAYYRRLQRYNIASASGV